MRTTVELSEEHRAGLLKLAAERGHKGFSAVLSEAVAAYLREQDREARRRRGAAALAAFEKLTPEFGEELEQNIREVRQSWRR